MPAPTHLLERAYQLISTKQLQSAELVLDAVVRVEPQNVDAWRAYLWILHCQGGVDWLKERILKTRELSEIDKAILIEYYLFLDQPMNNTSNFTNTNSVIDTIQEKEEISETDETSIHFELIDTLDYPAEIDKKVPLAKPHQREYYNTFILDIAIGALKALSRHPKGVKITASIQSMSARTMNFIRNPKTACFELVESPHFNKYSGAVLLILFILGVRLLESGHFWGYLLLGVFIFGGVRWLETFGKGSTTALSNQVHIYLYENKNKLPEIKETDQEQNQSDVDKES
jgi:hypothetical protein